MKARADRERGGGVRVLIVSLIKPWEAQGGWEMRWEVSELNVRSGRDVADFHEAYAHTHWEVERGSSAQSSVSYYPLNFSSPSRSIAPLSLCHSPSFALPIFHPLHPNYWCHCKLNCCSRVVTFPLKSPNRYLSWWKWRLFPSANFLVCVIGGTEENAGWLPPLLRNVFTKGCEKLWSLDSRPCISNILLLCLSLWVLCKHFSPRFLFVFCFCCSGLKSSSRFILIFGSFFLLSCGIAGLFHFTRLSGKKTMADTQSETSRWTYRSIKELKERTF